MRQGIGEHRTKEPTALAPFSMNFKHIWTSKGEYDLVLERLQ